MKAKSPHWCMGRKRRMSAVSKKYPGPRKPSSPSRGSRGSMARSIRRPRRGSAYLLKLTSMFRFQAGSSPSQCHQFRSPAWKIVLPSALTRKAAPSSVEGSASTATPGRGAARSPPERTRHFAAVPSERPHLVRFLSVRRIPCPSRKRISRRPSSRAKIPGVKWSGWRWLANTRSGLAGSGGSSPLHQSNSSAADGSSARKPLWSRKVTVIIRLSSSILFGSAAKIPPV